MVHGTSGDDGRFVVRFPAAWLTPGNYHASRMLWAFGPGRQLDWQDVYEALYSSHPEQVVITLGPPTDASFVVLGPDNAPVAGALVEPWHFDGAIVRSEIRPLVGGRSDAEGRVRLPAIPPKRMGTVQVTTEALGIQHFELRVRRRDGPEPAERTLQLARTGRIEGRLIAERRELLRSAEIFVLGDYRRLDEDIWTHMERRRAPTGFAEVTPDEDGRFVVPKFAVGEMLMFVDIDPSLPFRPRLPFGSNRSPTSVRVEAGKVTRVEIPLEKAVRVRGIVRVKQTAEPIVGALAVVSYGAHPPELVRTDEQGRFETYALPGAVTESVVYLPEDVVRPGELEELFQVYEVPAGVESFDFPPIEVVPAVAIEGRVIDESDRPVAGVHVSGIRRNRRYGSAVSDKDGRFTMRVPPNVEFEELSVWSREVRGEIEHTVVRKDPLLLRVPGRFNRKQP
jgi:hypothetical protein